jgi:hypothetical protein
MLGAQRIYLWNSVHWCMNENNEQDEDYVLRFRLFASQLA